MISSQLSLIFTGIMMSIIGGLFYEVTSSGFMVEGRYKSKPDALLIFLTSIVIMNFILVPIINQFWTSILTFFSLIGCFGLLFIIGMITVNHLVERWNYDDLHSIGIYLFGIFLILIDFFL